MTYIFDHIFKTAGSTFHSSYLTGAFPPEEIFVVPGFRDANREALQGLIALPEHQKAKLKVIAGHNTGCLRAHFPDAKFITLIRDPIDRGVSGYLHAKHHQDAWEFAGKRVAECKLGLAEFIREDFFAFVYADFVSMQNWQAKTVLGSRFKESLDQATATQVIRSRFHAIAPTNRLELFLVFLHFTEGFPLILFKNRLVRKERTSFQPDPDALAVIEHYNRFDTLVYKSVCREFDRALSAIWDSRKELLYQQYLASLRRFRQKWSDSDDSAPIPYLTPAAMAAVTQ